MEGAGYRLLGYRIGWGCNGKTGAFQVNAELKRVSPKNENKTHLVLKQQLIAAD